MQFIQTLITVMVGIMIIGFIIRIAGRVAATRREETFADRFEQFLEEAASRSHMVQEETHNDTIYWFDSDRGTFLAQGKDLTEIISVLKSRFPAHVFLLNGGEKMILGPDFDTVLDVHDIIPHYFEKTAQ